MSLYCFQQFYNHSEIFLIIPSCYAGAHITLLRDGFGLFWDNFWTVLRPFLAIMRFWLVPHECFATVTWCSTPFCDVPWSTRKNQGCLILSVFFRVSTFSFNVLHSAKYSSQSCCWPLYGIELRKFWGFYLNI